MASQQCEVGPREPGRRESDDFQHYVHLVDRKVRHFLGSDHELSDISQEVFARALTSTHLSRKQGLEPWLSRRAAITARSVLRGRSRRAWLCRFRDDNEEAKYEPLAAEVDWDSRLAVRAVYEILGAFSPKYRVPFTLRRIDGMELTEISDTCKLSLSTVKRRLRVAERRFLIRAKKQPALAAWLDGLTHGASRRELLNKQKMRRCRIGT